MNCVKNIMNSGVLAFALANPLISVKAQDSPIILEQRVMFDDSKTGVESETLIKTDDSITIIDQKGDSNRLGYENKLGDNLKLNIGYSNVDKIESKRINGTIDVGLSSINAGYHEKEQEDFWELYSVNNLQNFDLEMGINSLDHLAFIAKYYLEKNSVGLAGIASDDDFYRLGVACAHSGKMGLFSYAVMGKNEDGSSYHELRLRGGPGGKTRKESIGFFSVEEGCLFDENLVESLTDPYFKGITSTITNFPASIRGSPWGFDSKYKNYVFSLNVAVSKGPLTIIPGVFYNVKTGDLCERLEGHLDLPNGFYVLGQVDNNKDSDITQTYLFGWRGDF